MRLSPLLLAAVCAAAPSSAAAQAADTAAVVATITRMFDALRTKDGATVRAVLDSAARFTLLRSSPEGGARVVVLTGEQFVTAVTNPQGAGLDEPIRNVEVRIDGDLAAVWAEYQVRIDGNVSHCGYDAFHLVRKGGEWKILNVSDSFRQQGCGPAW